MYLWHISLWQIIQNDFSLPSLPAGFHLIVSFSDSVKLLDLLPVIQTESYIPYDTYEQLHRIIKMLRIQIAKDILFFSYNEFGVLLRYDQNGTLLYNILP